MLTKFNIKNYKSFKDVSFELKGLTLFSGPNSSGKSSAIQALLNAADNITTDRHDHKFVTRHTPAISFNEARNFMTNAKEFDIDLFENDRVTKLSFTPNDDAFIGINVRQEGFSEELYAQLHSNIFYLPAIRTWELNNSTINPNEDYNAIGIKGEYIIDFYQKHKTMILPESLLANKGIKTLEGQVNLWLKKLTGYRMAVDLDGSQYKVKFETPNGKLIFPYHIGTGISFLAELIIVCLAIPEEGIVIIENPEIHLHPSAQADLIDFLSLVANAKRHVVIESHSDHMFNGIRRQLHDGIIDLQNVNVYNFKHCDDGITTAELVELSQCGGIINYVPGMFEQFDKDLDDLLR